MKTSDTLYHIKNLKDLRKLYIRLLNDEKKYLYNDKELEILIFQTSEEVEKLLELINNYELDDSYDPNTGVYHNVYKGEF